MHIFPSRFCPVFIVCAAWFLLFATHAPAQSPDTDPYKTVVVSAPSPYWGYSYAPYAVVRTPLDGVAEVVRAEGDYMIKRQEAASRREDVRQKKLVTRRQQIEFWEWKRDFDAGALNRDLDRQRKAQQEYNLKHVSAAEIIGAVPLNVLYKQLAERPDLPAAGSPPIDDGLLAHINVNVSGRGNVGLLKGDTIPWPRLMLRSSFGNERDRIDDLLARGKKLALAPHRDQAAMAEVLDGLEAAVRACEDRLDREIRAGVHDPDCNPRHQIELARFLHEVTNSTFILKKEDAAFYFAPLQGKTVAELVAHMKKNGLLFAPATEGSERYYVALHTALADEVRRVTSPEAPRNDR